MHKGVILLTKASNQAEALQQVHNFMEGYQDNVWDWYAIGGRWNNNLAPRFNEWREYAFSHILKPAPKHGFISQQDIKTNQDKLQQTWRDMGMLGKNPYTNHYDLPEEGNLYDVVPLKECLGTVSTWVQTNEDIEAEYKKDMETWKDDPNMLEYLSRKYQAMKEGEFSFESNVYNIDTGQGESIPNNLTNYWAVMVDMHN